MPNLEKLELIEMPKQQKGFNIVFLQKKEQLNITLIY